MRGYLIGVVLGLLAGTAAAGSPLQGRWEIVAPSDPTFSGELVVDADGRAVSFGASLVTAKSYRSRGYISRLTDTKAEITLTGGAEVARIRCVIQSADTLNCDDMGTKGSGSPMYYMRRIGPGPASLLSER